ncbi:MAG: COQ9 family protein [Pseudomonadota bacterium]
MADDREEQRDRLIEAVLPHVAFDGWSADSLYAGAHDIGMDVSEARSLFPQPGADMAAAYHRMLDRRLAAELSDTDLSTMRIRERITFCVRRRLELIGTDREAVRRAATLFALPMNMPVGSKLIWETADTIWTACGDTADDYNWYTKRAILSGVYSATVLYWLGDQDPRSMPTWDFLDRRIDDVMRIETMKGQLRKNPLARAVFAVPLGVLSMVRAPRQRT